MKESVQCVVDDMGCIQPHFTHITPTCSGGYLKYFHNLSGKSVIVTIEVIDDEDSPQRSDRQ